MNGEIKWIDDTPRTFSYICRCIHVPAWAPDCGCSITIGHWCGATHSDWRPTPAFNIPCQHLRCGILGAEPKCGAAVLFKASHTKKFNGTQARQLLLCQFCYNQHIVLILITKATYLQEAKCTAYEPEMVTCPTIFVLGLSVRT